MDPKTLDEPRILANGAYVSFDDMTWPTPGDGPDYHDSLEWRLRYAAEFADDPQQMERDRLSAASIVAAYRDLLFCSREKRERVIRVMRGACFKLRESNRG